MTLRERVESAPVEELPGIAAEIAEAEIVLRLRVSGATPQPQPATQEPDRNIDIDEAVRLTGMSKSWIEKNAKRFKFTVRVGRRRLFSLRGLERWNRQNLTRTQAEQA